MQVYVKSQINNEKYSMLFSEYSRTDRIYFLILAIKWVTITDVK